MLAAVHNKLRKNRRCRPVAVPKRQEVTGFWKRIDECGQVRRRLFRDAVELAEIRPHGARDLSSRQAGQVLVVFQLARKEVLKRFADVAIYAGGRRVQGLGRQSAEELDQPPVRPVVVFDEALEVRVHGEVV